MRSGGAARVAAHAMHVPSLALIVLSAAALAGAALPAPARAARADEVPAPPAAGADGFRAVALADLAATSAASRLPAVAVVTADWSTPSRRFVEGALADADVRKMLAERTVAVHVAVPRAPEGDLAAWLEQRGVEELPAVLVLEAGERELGRLVGQKDADEVERELGRLIEAARPSSALRATFAPGELDRPLARYQLAVALIAEGAHGEALEHLLAAYDSADASEPGNAVLRNGAVLGALSGIARSHAPAREALVERRKAARTVIEAGTASPQHVADFAALCRASGAASEPLELYDALAADGAPGRGARAHLFEEVVGALVLSGRDADALAGVVDPLARVEKRIEEQKRAALHPVAGAENLQWRARRRVVEDGLLWYGPLLRVDRRVEANALADRLVAFDPSDATYAQLVRIAAASGKHAAARDLLQRGRALLADDQRVELEQAAALVPPAR